MNKFLVFLLSCMSMGSVWGQHSTQLFPDLGNKHIWEQGLLETANSIFVPSRNYGSQVRTGLGNNQTHPNALVLYKYNKNTSSFADSVVFAGDTALTDSIYRPFFTASCYRNGLMYFLNAKIIFNPGTNTTDGDRLFLSVIDTNLNVIISEKMIVEPQKSPCDRLLRSMVFYGDDLLVNYPCFVAIGSSGETNSRLLLFRTDGTFLKDTISGVKSPNPGFPFYPEISGLVKEVGNDTAVYIGGNALSNCITCLYQTDKELNVVKNYGQLNPYPISSPGVIDILEDPNATSFSDIINGQLFTAGEYLVREGPCENVIQTKYFTFISKHRKADSFKRSNLLTIPNSTCTNLSENRQFSHKVLYSKNLNQLYYVNYNHFGGFLNCDTSQNEIQIVCVDTNLNMKWRKLISPKANTCTQTLQVLLPEEGTGLTIAGNYFDTYSFQDSSLSGTFLLRFDSTGLLSTGSNPQFTVRDRFNVYPNPTKGDFWVEDIAGVPAKAFIYDLAGRQIATYSLTGRRNRLELPAGKPGMYLLRIVPEWGEDYSQMVQVTE